MRSTVVELRRPWHDGPGAVARQRPPLLPPRRSICSSGYLLHLGHLLPTSPLTGQIYDAGHLLSSLADHMYDAAHPRRIAGWHGPDGPIVPAIVPRAGPTRKISLELVLGCNLSP
jgi:hypothetical protein